LTKGAGRAQNGGMFPHPDTGEMTEGIARARYTHQAMADLVIADPSISQNQIAAHFGYSAPWVSRIFNSDAFRAYLHARKEELTDPELRARIEARMQQIEEQLRTIADLSLSRLIDRLAGVNPITGLPDARPMEDDFLLKTASMAKDALGYGARPKEGGNGGGVQVVINMPEKAQNTSQWLERHASGYVVPASSPPPSLSSPSSGPDHDRG